MRVVKKGKPQNKDYEYQFECSSCGSLLRAKRKDLHSLHWYGQRAGYIYFCPVCKTERKISNNKITIEVL